MSDEIMSDEINRSDSSRDTTAVQSGSSPRLPVAMLIGVVVVGAALAALLLINRQQVAPRLPSLTEEAEAYAAQLEFYDFQLSEADNMLGSQIVYLDGRIVNNGSRQVRTLRMRLDFQDTLGQTILREYRDVIPMAVSQLEPGESRDFQLRFDRPPASWNILPPQLGILSLEIE